MTAVVMMQRETSSGTPFPLGATVRDGGVNFAIVADGLTNSDDTSGIELCLFTTDTVEQRIPVTEYTAGIWHIFVPGVEPGTRYGYRVARHDSSKILLDPYARQVNRTTYDVSASSAPGVDTADTSPLGIVTGAQYSTSSRPQIPWEHTVIYEAHVKGLTAQHPDIPPELRGTYLGIAQGPVINYLQSLHISALQLLPVHAHAAEPLLARAGRKNYWGYSTLNFFAPHPEYAAQPGNEISEFITMVDALHDAGIELLLDVVYNHTCEGDSEDPITLSWRGLSPGSYYVTDNDLTGTGNTLDTGSLPTIRMVADSLRYWAQLGVDGFRFDLASVLGRPSGGEFDAAAPLLTVIEADPVLQSLKLIAEPWDATGEGYQLGAFGPVWAEWNDQFRDTVRDYWRGVPAIRPLGYRLTGSEDVFGSQRRPWASVNFITAHDGFTLRDVVSYEQKHNEANGQDNLDGSDDNRSCNYGVEGDGSADSPLPDDIAAVRLRQVRNVLATLLLSTGTPMLCAGDEMWRTQAGNNNAYTDDSPVTWLDWQALANPDSSASIILEFTRRVVQLRAHAPALHQGEFFSGRPPQPGTNIADIMWLTLDGLVMDDADWFNPEQRSVQLWFNGARARSHGPQGGKILDHSWLLVLHADNGPAQLTVPASRFGASYQLLLDTDQPTGSPLREVSFAAGAAVTIPGRTVWLFQANPAEGHR